MKVLYFIDLFGNWPLKNGLHFRRIHFDNFYKNDIPQKSHLIYCKSTFLCVCVEFILS